MAHVDLIFTLNSRGYQTAPLSLGQGIGSNRPLLFVSDSPCALAMVILARIAVVRHDSRRAKE